MWYEIWGVVDPGQKISISTGKFPKKFQYFQAILQKNIEFCRKISENFDFFQAIKKIRFSKQKIVHLQLPLAKLFYFSSKVTTFEHTSCTMYMIRYNISRPVHDSNDPLRPSLGPPCPKSRGRDPQPPGLTPLDSNGKEAFSRRKELPRGGLRRMKMPQEKNGENTDLKCDLVLCRNKDYEKGGHHKI